MGKPTTGKYSQKPYKCLACGHESLMGTNHWGECYPQCRMCGVFGPHQCLEPCPPEYDLPEKWKTVKGTTLR